MQRRPAKLKGKAKRRKGPYPLGEIPAEVAIAIGKKIAHRLAVGHADISGDDFGGIFATAIGGTHRAKPLGVADVIWNGCAWTVKTVQGGLKTTRVRLISGRNDPNYSAGIADPYSDIQATGRAVLDIWNARVDEALKEHDDLRMMVMIRDMASLEFVLFEREAQRFIPGDYRWERNKHGNLEGFDATTDEHRFTWQPHGSQFTIIDHVPASARHFRVKRPKVVEETQVLEMIEFKEDWIEDLKQQVVAANERLGKQEPAITDDGAGAVEGE